MGVNGRVHARCLATIAVAGSLLLPAAPASARSALVRRDPNDSAASLDIRKVQTNVTRRRVFFDLTMWNRFTLQDIGHPPFMTVYMDTRRPYGLDRRVLFRHNPNRTTKCQVFHLGRSKTFIGQRRATKPGPSAIACRLPARWFGIQKPVEFAVRVQGFDRLRDRAPNVGRYVGL